MKNLVLVVLGYNWMVKFIFVKGEVMRVLEVGLSYLLGYDFFVG